MPLAFLVFCKIYTIEVGEYLRISMVSQVGSHLVFGLQKKLPLECPPPIFKGISANFQIGLGIWVVPTTNLGLSLAPYLINQYQSIPTSP